jgi:iron(III) transport system ATP-binding protein
MGAPFQSYAIWPNMTVAQNVRFGLEVRQLHARGDPGQGRPDPRRRADEAPPRPLSPGAVRRPAAARGAGRAIVVQPGVLLLDEPLSNLDANLREEMRYEIRRLHDEFRTTTVYVTHDQAEAMVTSDRIAVMNQGRVEQVDEPRALYARPRTRFIAGFIGRTNFLDGKARGGQLAFDGFAIPRVRFAELAPLSGKVAFSLRPQSIHLHRQAPSLSDQAAVIPGAIVQRAYLGEYWDYAVRPAGSDLSLRVSTRPHEVFEVGAKVWLELDPQQLFRSTEAQRPRALPEAPAVARLLEGVANRRTHDLGRVVLQVVPEEDGRHAGDERVELIRPPVILLEGFEDVAGPRRPPLQEVV